MVKSRVFGLAVATMMATATAASAQTCDSQCTANNFLGAYKNVQVSNGQVSNLNDLFAARDSYIKSLQDSGLSASQARLGFFTLFFGRTGLGKGILGDFSRSNPDLFRQLQDLFKRFGFNLS